MYIEDYIGLILGGLLALLVGIAVVPYVVNGDAHLEEVKKAAPQVWAENGFEIVGYEGYTWGWGIGGYGGAKVWHVVSKIPSNGITYEGYIQKWGDEYHVYNLIAVDAIKP